MGAISAKDQERAQGWHECVGVAGHIETTRRLWNHYFASVACNTLGLKVRVQHLRTKVSGLARTKWTWLVITGLRMSCVVLHLVI
jgi:hypothetical protein